MIWIPNDIKIRILHRLGNGLLSKYISISVDAMIGAIGICQAKPAQNDEALKLAPAATMNRKNEFFI